MESRKPSLLQPVVKQAKSDGGLTCDLNLVVGVALNTKSDTPALASTSVLLSTGFASSPTQRRFEFLLLGHGKGLKLSCIGNIVWAMVAWGYGNEIF